MGKGDKRRPRSITSAEENLRQEFARGVMTIRAFNRRYAKLKRAGLLRRGGQVLR